MSIIAELGSSLFALLAAPFAAAGAVSGLAPRPDARGQAEGSPAAPATRMSAAQQWDKISGILNRAIGSATTAKDLQSGAALQLDLATYALHSLMDEVSAVMMEPLLGREGAAIHRLPAYDRRSAATLARAA